MVQIPKANFNNRLSTDVRRDQTTAISEAGRVGRALQGFGAQVTQTAGTFETLDRRREKANADNYYQRVKSNFDIEMLDQTQKNIKLRDGTDYTGYTEENQKSIEKLRKLAMDGTENPLAQQRLQGFFDTERDARRVTDKSAENTFAAKFYLAEDRKGLEKLKTASLNAPNLKSAMRSYDGNVVHIAGSELYTAEMKSKLIDKNAEILTSYLEGALIQGGGTLLEAKSFLEGKSGEQNDVALQALGKHRSDFLEKIERKMVHENDVAMATTAQANKTISAEMELADELTGTVPGPLRAKLDDGIDKLVTLMVNIKDPLKRAKVQNIVDSAKAERSNYDWAKDRTTMTVSQTKNMDLLKGLEGLSPEVKLGALAQRKKLKNKALKEALENGAAYSMKKNSKLKEGTVGIITAQEVDGIPFPRHFTDASEASMERGLANAPDPSAEWNRLLQENPDMGKAIGGMAIRHPSLKKFAIANDMTDPNTRNLFLKVKDGPIRTAYDKKATSEGLLTSKELDTEVFKKLQPLSKAFAGDSVMNNTMRTKAGSIARHFVMQENMDPKEAAKKASEMVTKNYTIVEDGDFAFHIPPTYKSSEAGIRHTTGFYLKEGTMQATIDDWGLKLEDQPNVHNVKNMKHFLNELKENGNLRYKNSADGKGLNVVFLGDTSDIPLMKTDEFGTSKPFFLPYDDINKPNGRFAASTMDSLKKGSTDLLDDEDKLFLSQLEGQINKGTLRNSLGSGGAKRKPSGVVRGEASRKPSGVVRGESGIESSRAERKPSGVSRSGAKRKPSGVVR